MSKKILLIASSCFLFFSFSKGVSAQTDNDYFKLPDTVCADHEITPLDVVEGASNYNWSFCPPDLYAAPNGFNSGIMASVNKPNAVVMAQDEGANYAFTLNSDGGLIRFKFENGYSGDATQTSPIGYFANSNGLYAVKTDVWKVFVLVNAPTGFKLVRYDFPNGLKAAPVENDLGTISSAIPLAKKLYLAQDGDQWYGFSFTDDDELLRLTFGTDINSTPAVENLGNINNQFSGASGFAAIVELGNWHILVPNETASNLVRISFGNSLANTPFIVDLGDMTGRIKAPVGIAITRGCDAYYAYVLNKGTASLVALKWDNQSIANPPTAVNHGNVAGYVQPISLSGIVEDSGALFMFSGNNDQTLSKMKFEPCTTASITSSNLQYPVFSYSEPGIHTAYLTINQGLPNVGTDCERIFISAHPSITISNDTLICQGDTLDLSILSFGADSFRWAPDYRINTLEGQFVKVWPEFSTEYTATAYYAPNCIVKSPVEVKVSNIQADAGADRTLSDGSATILGGPKTTLGDQYTYLWTPDIGFAGVGSTGDPITKAIPPYNLTYYLTVTNTDGCRVMDSVIVRTPCDRVNLPNAFSPESSSPASNTFGISNLQFAKINYFRIFDRWGKEVFSTIDPNVRWDGKVDGKRAPMGAYVWEIDANCANTQERFRQSGSVTLIR